MINLATFEEKIGVTFNNKELLKRALTHRSYINEQNDNSLKHNERLEFLGDAVLELAVTTYLFNEFPDRPEGDLTAFRSSLVNTITISDAAEKLGANDYLLLSKGEAKDTGKARQYILANTFEALVGAIYLDQGYKIAEKFVADALFYRLPEIIKKGLWKDAKSWVQEKAQEVEGITPSYEVLAQVGPDHDKTFTVGIFFGDTKVAEGVGHSKQEAEQNAARAALDKKGWV